MSENQSLESVIDPPTKERKYLTEYYDLVHRYLFSLTSSLVEADDLAQETYLRSICHINRRGSPQKPLMWLLTIARNAYADGTRRSLVRESGALKSVESSLVNHGQTPLGNVCFLEQITDTQRALDELGSPDRNLMAEFYKDGRTYRELAQQYGLSENAVKSRLHRAKKRIRLRENKYLPI